MKPNKQFGNLVLFTCVLYIGGSGLCGQSGFGQDKPEQDNKNQIGSNVTISDQAEKLGFDIAKLKEIDRRLADLVKDKKVMGCSAMVYRKGEEVLFGTWGNQNEARKKPVTRDTIFRIYSMSKPITSIAAMQLAEQGKLDIDAPVSDYLPEFKNLKVLERSKDGTNEVAPKRPMTTRDLLRHTSGLTYGFFGNTQVDQAYRKAGVLLTEPNIEKTVEKLGKIPLLHHPGTRFHYSVSADVLGRVVEVASGMNFDEYLQANVFKRLKMQDTFFTVPKDKQNRFAQLYKPDNSGKLVVASLMQSIRFFNQDNEFYSGGGGLCSTTDDYLAFCKMLLGKGSLNDQQVVKPKTIQEMFKNQLTDVEGSKSFKFGLGFRIAKEGDYGWGGAAGTKFWVNPQKDLAIIFMMQIMPNQNRNYGELVRSLTYKALD